MPRAGETWARAWLLDAWVTYNVPAQVSGSGNGQVRVLRRGRVTSTATAAVLTSPPGSTTIAIPIQVTGNTQPGDGRTYRVAAKAVSGASIGDAYGLLTVQDDDV